VEGKLFIVGDPKQSIYAFRRADIEAFDHVVERMERSGALRCELATNFRSHAQVLDLVNGVFNTLLVAQPAIQPPNVPLTVQPNRSSQFRNAGVELRLVASEEEDDLDSAAATRVEAEHIARMLSRLLSPTETGAVTTGPETGLRPGHVALLFRKLTQAEQYLYAINLEKRMTEIIDGIFKLAMENKSDEVRFFVYRNEIDFAKFNPEFHELGSNQTYYFVLYNVLKKLDKMNKKYELFFFEPEKYLDFISEKNVTTSQEARSRFLESL
jgi:ATP-dependent exoDNAse (exonuclease V) beta subunit